MDKERESYNEIKKEVAHIRAAFSGINLRLSKLEQLARKTDDPNIAKNIGGIRTHIYGEGTS